MKVVYLTCCGIDVHKSFLVATIIKTEDVTPKYSQKRFSAFNNSILQLKQWLIENDCFDERHPDIDRIKNVEAELGYWIGGTILGTRVHSGCGARNYAVFLLRIKFVRSLVRVF